MHCGLYQLLVNNGRVFGFMAVFSYIYFFAFSTISKDYDGARTVVIYQQ
jgi:hypothetical protein